MEHTATRVRDCVTLGAIPLVILAFLPILAAVVFVFRPIALVGLLAALIGGSIIWACSMRFREWLSARTGEELVYRGLRIAPDFSFDPSHSWAQVNGEVIVGADDLVQATLGPVEGVELPAKGRHVRRGDRLFRLRSADRTVEVHTPVSGVVLETNETLRVRPELINESPFGGGWAVRIRGDHLEEEQALLLRGKRARGWFHDDVDRIVDSLPARSGDEERPPPREIAPSEICRRVSAERWSRLTETMFAPHPLESPES